MSSISCGCFINGIAPMLWDRDVSFVIQIEINYTPLLTQPVINFLHTRVLSINLRLNCDCSFLSQGGSVRVEMAWELCRKVRRSTVFSSIRPFRHFSVINANKIVKHKLSND